MRKAGGSLNDGGANGMKLTMQGSLGLLKVGRFCYASLYLLRREK